MDNKTLLNEVSKFLCFSTLYKDSKASFNAIAEEESPLAIGVIIQAVTCLEAFVNEIAYLVSEEQKYGRNYNTCEAATIYLDVTDLLSRKLRLEEKYQYTYLCFKGERFETGSPPFQNFCLLIKLRNALVHAQVASRDLESKADGLYFTGPDELSAKLGSAKILSGNDSQWWLLRVRNKTAAKWALNVASTTMLTILEVIPKEYSEIFLHTNIWYKSIGIIK